MNICEILMICQKRFHKNQLNPIGNIAALSNNNKEAEAASYYEQENL